MNRFAVSITIFLALFIAAGFTAYRIGAAVGASSKAQFAAANATVASSSSSGKQYTVAASEVAAGKKVFDTNCAACHQTTGLGVPGAFPPLKQHIVNLMARAGGRIYLGKVLLYGIQGKIKVLGKTYNGVMPAWGSILSSKQIAEAVNYALSSWGNQLPKGKKPISVSEIDRLRKKQLSPQQVYKLQPSSASAAAKPSTKASSTTSNTKAKASSTTSKAPTSSGKQYTVAASEVAAGKKVFDTNCAVCHQTTGLGVPGAFPPLKQHIVNLMARAGGRIYLGKVLLYGIQGKIKVLGKTYNGVMPAWGSILSSKQIAEAVNYALSSWGNQLPKGKKPISVSEIDRLRKKQLSPQQVYKLQPKGG